ncbi:MAG: MmcQ/YjbR family DNA-binding protein [Clostridia bacterium]|nr:MmcQ/YjbR family DNA-binding protein [Clostridia bacterium]
MIKSLREKIFEYVKEVYQSEIEYPWFRFPNYCVFRHKDNKKWYGIIMDVPYKKLGIDKDGVADILNVKAADFMFKEFLIKQNGIIDGYHIARGNWISILLDGSVELKQIYDLLDQSFVATGRKKKSN